MLENQLHNMHITILSPAGEEIFDYSGMCRLSEKDTEIVDKQILFIFKSKEFVKEVEIYDEYGIVFKSQLDADVIITMEYLEEK